MSNLRIIGLIVGILGLYLTFRIYRGPRWRRLNFVLFGLFSLSLIAVSLNPNLLNTTAQMLRLERQQRGRILVLLIGSNILLWFVFIYLKTKLDDYKHQFDLLVRSLGYGEVKHMLGEEIRNKDIVIIIPAYNEADSLRELLRKFPHSIEGRKVGVLIVDDGSIDDTGEIVLKNRCFLVQNRFNRGQGAASRLGYDVLVRNNVKVGVTMDADGQHNPQEISKLVKPILEGKYDLIIGSRVLGKSEKTTKLRKIGVSFLTKIINMLTGLALTDCSSGFKAFNMDKMRRLKLTEDQFQSAEVIIEAVKKGLRIGEVPITILERKYGKSKKGKDWKYGLGFVKTIIKSWWRKI